MSTSLLEVSLLGVGTVLRLERDAWSMVKRLRQATNEYTPAPHRPQTKRGKRVLHHASINSRCTTRASFLAHITCCRTECCAVGSRRHRPSTSKSLMVIHCARPFPRELHLTPICLAHLRARSRRAARKYRTRRSIRYP